LVFWGKPRNQAAAQAHESPNSMTVPLMILAVFALVGGFANAPFLGSPLHHFMANIHQTSHLVNVAATEFNFVVAGMSTILAVTGLLAGWLLYRNYQAGQVEPFKRYLGPVFTLLERKYYIDEFYQLAVVQPVVWLADQVFNFDYRWVIDPFVNLVAAVGRWAADISGVFDNVVIDTFLVEGAARAFNAAGRWLRYTQTGRVHNYLLVVVVTVLMLVGLYLYL
jgi:NADH-quinone oxidoreductase subunit L